MHPFYKTYISALLHKPDLISNSISAWLDTKDDAEAEKALNFLHASAIVSRNEIWTDWKDNYSNKPPEIKLLFAYILNKDMNQEDKQYIIANFPEAIYLKEVYENIEPDKESLATKPMLKDAFGFEREKQEGERISGATYFDDIGTFGKNMKCPLCHVTTYVNNYNRFRYSAKPIDNIVYQYEHQCQECGKMQMADVDDKTDTSIFIQKPCECGGQFRRDKPLFCPNCKAFKREINKSEWD